MELLRLWTKFLAVAGGMIARGIGFPANHHGAVQALTMRALTWLLFSAPRHGEILSLVAASKTAHACGSTLEGFTRRDSPPDYPSRQCLRRRITQENHEKSINIHFHPASSLIVLFCCSAESGVAQISVLPFPGPGGKWQISADGGAEPRWSRNGHELFYINRGQLVAVTYAVAKNSFQAGKPQVLSGSRFEMCAVQFV
jgi:hypothetical protein